MKCNGNLADQFVEHLFRLQKEGFPQTVQEKAKYCLLDYLGVTLAGASQAGPAAKAVKQPMYEQYGEVPVVGTDLKTDMLSAALLNGMHAHYLELDDGHRYGMIHPGAAVISALLPWAVTNKLSGNDLLTGIIMGYEAAIILATCLQPGMKEKGYHATGTCGTIGAAMGAAFASGYTISKLKSTLAAACTSASGLLEVIRDRSQLKPYNAGQAAVNGLMAAIIGRSGLEGPDDILGGSHGFMRLMGSGDIHDLPCDNMPAIQSIYVKPYAACRHAHSPIEAILNIRANNRINPNEVDAIVVHTYRWAVYLHDHTDVSGIESAKMSTPYSVAVALVTGNAGMDEFSEKYISDPLISSLTKRVKVVEDEALSKLVPGKRTARVEVKMRNRVSYSEQVDLPKGEPEKPITQKELIDKFSALAMYAGKTELECENITNIVFNIEQRLEELFQHN